MKKISKEEAKNLKELYRWANETPDIKFTDKKDEITIQDIVWNKVKEYYNILAKKYNFDVNKVAISKMGKIMELKKCFNCGTTATTEEGTRYVRGDKENMPICKICFVRYYPEKAFKEEYEL